MIPLPVFAEAFVHHALGVRHCYPKECFAVHLIPNGGDNLRYMRCTHPAVDSYISSHISAIPFFSTCAVKIIRVITAPGEAVVLEFPPATRGVGVEGVDVAGVLARMTSSATTSLLPPRHFETHLAAFELIVELGDDGLVGQSASDGVWLAQGREMAPRLCPESARVPKIVPLWSTQLITLCLVTF